MVGPAAGRPAPAAAAQGLEAVHASSCVAYWGRTTRSPWGSAHQARRSGHVGSPGRLLPHCAGRTPPGHSPAGHEQTGAAVQSMQSKLNEPGAGTTMIILGGCRLLSVQARSMHVGTTCSQVLHDSKAAGPKCKQPCSGAASYRPGAGHIHSQGPVCCYTPTCISQPAPCLSYSPCKGGRG
jgi:hypothetical protein